MENLFKLLRKEKYRKISFKISRTQHLLIKVSVNGIKGNFLLDTGASSSCVSFESVELFQLKAGKSDAMASGAGSNELLTQLAKDNVLQIGSWKSSELHLIIFDMSHINTALQLHNIKTIHGIIGADILLAGKAIIDYNNYCLYLKQ